MSRANPKTDGASAENLTHAELFESVFNSVNSLIAYFDKDFNYIRVNKAFAEAKGRPPSFFCGKNHFRLFPDSGNEAVFRQVAETGSPLHEFEKSVALMSQPSDRASYWDWSLEPVRRGDGRIVGLVLTLIDVTERRRAKEALRASEAHREEILSEREEVEQARTRLAAAIEQAVESVAMTDRDGVIQYVNPAFERTTGYTREEIAGRHLKTLESEPQTESHDKSKWATMARGDVWRGRGVRKKKSGDLYQVESSITPIRDPDDPSTIAEYVVTERDISKEVELEKQLRQTQKMEALGTLAGGIAHDLNNILMPIIMNVEMISEDVDESSPLHHFAKKVLSSAHRGRNLVRRILTFSREKDAEQKRFSIAQPVEEALDLVRPTLLSTVKLKQRIAKDAGQVKGDPAEIQEMIVNLCSNAAHAVGMERGTIDVRLENVLLGEEGDAVHSELRPGPFVKLSIRDTGVGMDDRLMERIFDPFFTTKKPSEGTGMGLAMVHGAVRRHGGAISVSSAPGRGALFEVFLPRVTEVAEKTESLRPTPRGNNEQVLLVDDERDIVEAAQNVIERLGYRVMAETTAEGAFDVFVENRDRIDLIILDFVLAEMTGLDLARQMREIREDVPIVMATGFSGAVNRSEMETLGISRLISKPLTSQEIGETIRAVLDSRRISDSRQG
jgi:PAS domain S-box-containing protein